VHSKILDLNAMIPRLASHRQRLDRIIVAAGDFDSLRASHVAFLEAARRLGDVLAVMVYQDASVAIRTGLTSPEVPEEDRAYLVASLACVDYVVIADEEVEQNLLEAIRPAAFVVEANRQPMTNWIQQFTGVSHA
jgi:D-beta-D-heptose 7-phosphate kinase/D-beta-D-heptose 1-phosphate adenosyltransferase